MITMHGIEYRPPTPPPPRPSTPVNKPFVPYIKPTPQLSSTGTPNSQDIKMSNLSGLEHSTFYKSDEGTSFASEFTKPPLMSTIPCAEESTSTSDKSLLNKDIEDINICNSGSDNKTIKEETLDEYNTNCFLFDEDKPIKTEYTD
jgi:hypothetical protein